ncbi:MAG: hypothetical protein LUO88_00805, partial [Methanoregulaceae archaeon]|nr:hypothetical protein [Methanoregulaceae archaeon]
RCEGRGYLEHPSGARVRCPNANCMKGFVKAEEEPAANSSAPELAPGEWGRKQVCPVCKGDLFVTNQFGRKVPCPNNCRNGYVS